MMEKQDFMNNNEAYIEYIDELLKDNQQEDAVFWLEQLQEILKKGILSDTDNVYQEYAICKEDEELFRHFINELEVYLERKYKDINLAEEQISNFQQLNFNSQDLIEVDENIKNLKNDLSNENLYSKKERKEIDKLIKKLEQIKAIISPLYTSENKEEKGIHVIRNLSKKEQRKICDALEDDNKIKSFLENFIWNMKEKTKAKKEKFQSIKSIKSIKSIIKKPFSKKNFNILDKLKQKTKKRAISKDLPDYLTFKNYMLTQELLKKKKNEITNKELKKYANQIHKIDKKYDQILQGNKPNEILSDINNVSAMHAKRSSKNARELLKYNADGYLDGQSYLDYIENLKNNDSITEETKDFVESKFDELYSRNLTFKECMEKLPENIKNAKNGYRKVMRKMVVTGTSISLGVALFASALLPNFSKPKTQTPSISQTTQSTDQTIEEPSIPESESKIEIINTPSETIAEENKEQTEIQNENDSDKKIEISLDEYLENTVNKEELEKIKSALTKVQEKINQNTTKVEEVINVGDYVEIEANAPIYDDIYSLAYDQNAKTSLYQDQEVRVVESIIFQSETGEIIEEQNMENYTNLVANGYAVIGYTVANQYSGNAITIEGRYKTDDVMTLTRK